MPGALAPVATTTAATDRLRTAGTSPTLSSASAGVPSKISRGRLESGYPLFCILQSLPDVKMFSPGSPIKCKYHCEQRFLHCESTRFSRVQGSETAVTFVGVRRVASSWVWAELGWLLGNSSQVDEVHGGSPPLSTQTRRFRT